MADILPEIIDNIKIENDSDDGDVIFEQKSGTDSEDEGEGNNIKKEIIEVEKRPKLEQEQIFQTPIVKPVAKKKREMTKVRLEQLAKAREKAYASKRLKKEARQKEVDEIVSQKKEKLIENRVKKAVSRADKQLDKEQLIVQNVSQNINTEDIQYIVSQSIMKYDDDRKEKKAQKKKKQAEEQSHEKINNTIRSAVNKQKAINPSDAGYFDNCFG